MGERKDKGTTKEQSPNLIFKGDENMSLSELKAMQKEIDEGVAPILTPIKAIRAKCLDCSNYQYKEIRLCPIIKCPIWHYRMGRRPIKEVENNEVE